MIEPVNGDGCVAVYFRDETGYTAHAVDGWWRVCSVSCV